MEYNFSDYVSMAYLPTTLNIVDLKTDKEYGFITVEYDKASSICRILTSEKTYICTLDSSVYTLMGVYARIRAWLNYKHNVDILGYGSLWHAIARPSAVIDYTSPNSKSPYGFDVKHIFFPLEREKYIQTKSNTEYGGTDIALDQALKDLRNKKYNFV